MFDKYNELIKSSFFFSGKSISVGIMEESNTLKKSTYLKKFLEMFNKWNRREIVKVGE